jgi:hypothetical protein
LTGHRPQSATFSYRHTLAKIIWMILRLIGNFNMHLKNLLVLLFLILSLNVFGQGRIHLGFDAGLIMCFTHYKLETDLDRANQVIYNEGSFNDPNYMIGVKSKYSFNDKHSLITGLNYIHKNLGIEYSNKLDDRDLYFSFYGATYNFEIPLTYSYSIAKINNPDFTLSALIGGTILLYNYDFTSFYNHTPDFEIVQTNRELYNLLTTNFSLKTGIMSSSYNPKIGFYEFGLNYSVDILSTHKEEIEIYHDNNTNYADFDIHLTYFSIFFRLYLFDYSLFQGRIYKI